MRGYALIALAALLWAAIGPLGKIAFEAGMQPLEVGFWRTAIAWALFAGQAVLRGKTRVERRHLPVITIFGLTGILGLFGFYQLAVKLGGAALASVLLYTAPAWVALLARLTLREPLTAGKLTAVALTILGVAGVSFGTGGAEAAGQVGPGAGAILFGLLAGASYALYYIFGKLYLERYETPTLFLWALPVGAAAMTPFFSFATHPPLAWLCVGAMALFSTFLAYSVYYAGLRDIDATRASVVATLEPVAASIVAWVVWDEKFGVLGYLGSLLILAAVLVAILDGARSRSVATGEGRAGSQA